MLSCKLSLIREQRFVYTQYIAIKLSAILLIRAYKQVVQSDNFALQWNSFYHGMLALKSDFTIRLMMMKLYSRVVF